MNRVYNKAVLSVAVAMILCSALGILSIGCDEDIPNRNTPTSGELTLFVDELYVDLVQPFIDSFSVRAPSTKIEIVPINARDAVEQMINLYISDSVHSDTVASIGIITGRTLLNDERAILGERKLDSRLIELKIATDGLAVVVKSDSKFTETTLEALSAALATDGRAYDQLQKGLSVEKVQFLFPGPNSSVYGYVRDRLLGTKDVAGPVKWFSNVDSLIDLVSEGKGIGLLNWSRISGDSNRVRSVRVGFTDSVGIIQKPVRIHPTSLVMNLYPMELQLTGYTLDGPNRLANGFLSWIAKSEIAQKMFAERGLEPENVMFRLERSE